MIVFSEGVVSSLCLDVACFTRVISVVDCVRWSYIDALAITHLQINTTKAASVLLDSTKRDSSILVSL